MIIDEKTFLDQYNIHDYEVPLASVDMSIFCIIDNKLHVLLVTRDEHPCLGQTALPGGFVNLNIDENLDETAHRKLTEKTAIQSPYLEQVGSFGGPKRDPRGWSITVLYFALIDFHSANVPSESGEWVEVGKALKMDLAFDHSILLNEALERLRSRTRYTALPIALMPEDFTLTELQAIFEVILGRKLPLKSFRRRVLTSEILIPTDKSKIAGKRPAQIYNKKDVPRDFSFPRPLEL